MDPARTLSPKLRRQLLHAVVQDNVYIKQGKRPPLPRPRRGWRRWLAAGVALPTVVAAALLLLPDGRPRARTQPVRAARGLPSKPVQPVAAPAPRTTPVGVLSLAPQPLDSSVFPVGVRRIVLDPGHGGKDVGTEAPGGLFEKDIALDIALRLRELLRQRGGVEVLLTRDHDEQVLLRDRARFANDARADLFVSIHLNWLEPATNRGVETFYLGPSQDPDLVQVTARENRESGYSLADVRRLLDGIYLDLRQQESQRLASSVQRRVYRALEQQEASATPRDRGVKSAPFLVLVATDMPAVLAEVSCLSNDKEAALLATTGYRQALAEALRDGIAAYSDNLSHTILPTRKAATGSPT